MPTGRRRGALPDAFRAQAEQRPCARRGSVPRGAAARQRPAPSLADGLRRRPLAGPGSKGQAFSCLGNRRPGLGWARPRRDLRRRSALYGAAPPQRGRSARRPAALRAHVPASRSGPSCSGDCPAACATKPRRRAAPSAPPHGTWRPGPASTGHAQQGAASAAERDRHPHPAPPMEVAPRPPPWGGAHEPGQTCAPSLVPFPCRQPGRRSLPARAWRTGRARPCLRHPSVVAQAQRALWPARRLP